MPAHAFSQLPALHTRFIGREHEIAEIKRLVFSTRLLTLTGPGGCGKTRLAIAAAQVLLKSSRFDHRIWFIDLSGLDAPGLIPQAIATALGIPEERDRALAETLTDFLQPRRCLLILDNCERLIAACAELVQTLLEACPHLHILATSREPLNLQLELTWLVPSLALPEPQHSTQFKQLAKFEAVELFVARASAALPGFRLNEANAPTVERICRRLDGIPLAIELAAARVKLLDIEQIAARVDDSLQLLAHGDRTAAPRHKTMRAALDWSYHLLLPREQVLFRRLAVFAGSFTLDAVEAICTDPESGGSAMQTADVLDVLSDLVDKSLVLITEREPGEAVRQRLLEPIRQYALDQLREAGEETIVRDRHLAYSIDFAEQAERELKGANQLSWLKRMDKEYDNVRAAMAWCSRDASRDIAALRLAKAMHLFWQRRGYWSEGQRELEQAIANYDTHDSSHSRSGHLYLARAIVALSWLAVYLQNYSNTRESLERGLALAQASGDSATMAHALGLLSLLSAYAGNLAAATQCAAASVASARQAGDPWSLAWSLHVFGRNRYAIGDEKAGRAALEESEALYRKTGDQRSLAVHINNEAIIAEHAGELNRARSLFEETLAIGQALEDNELQVKVLGNLASLALMQDDILRAEQLYEQAITQVRGLGEHLTIGSNLIGLARIRMMQGDFETADQYLHESLAWARKLGHQMWLALSLAGLGRLQVERGQARQAARLWGAIDATLQRKLDADDRFVVEQWEAAVRAALTPEEFSAAFTAGQGLSLKEAVQEVLDSAREVDRMVPRPAPATPQLQVNALGPTRVLASGRLLTSWPYARVKELLVYLISYPARTKAQIGLALWPDASPRQLRNSLGITLYHLRRTLGHPQWIIFEDDVYRFNRGLDYQFDVEAFEANLAQAGRLQKHAPQRAMALLQTAVDLYQGDFIEDYLEGEWFLLQRENLRQKYLDALLDLGRMLFTHDEYARAAEFYRRAIEKDEMFEEAHRELMRCYARLGERGQALRHYHTFEQMMRDELGSLPAAESAALYERLKRGETI